MQTTTPAAPAAVTTSHDKVGAGTTASCRTYRGKYPDRIHSVSSCLRQEGDRWAPLLIESNDGARFVFRRLHVEAPMPKVGQDVEFWLYHVNPLNDQAYDTFARYGIDPK